MDASVRLLISQYAGARNLRALIQAFLDVAHAEVENAMLKIQQNLNLTTAQGVWLDYLGNRLGVPRPAGTHTGPVFGFDDAGVGFEQARISDKADLEPLAPIADTLYRRILRARAIAVHAIGTINDITIAAHQIDQNSNVTDRLDKTVRIVTNLTADMTLARDVHALPKPAGITLDIVAGNRFGFDDAGVGFDQGTMEER